MWAIFLGEHAKNKSPTLMTVLHCAKWTCRFIFAQEPWKWNSIIALQLFALKIIFLQAIKLKSNHIILFAIFSWLEVSCVSTLKLVWDFFLLLTISYYKAPKNANSNEMDIADFGFQLFWGDTLLRSGGWATYLSWTRATFGDNV